MERQPTLFLRQAPTTGQVRFGGLQGAVRTLLTWRLAWLGMDKNPRALAFVQSWRGALVVHLGFFALLATCWLTDVQMALAVATLTSCLLLPRRRVEVLGIAGVASLLAQPFRDRSFEELSTGWFARDGIGGPQLQIAAVAAAFLLLCWFALTLQGKFRGNPAGRRPIVAQFAVMAALIATARTLPLRPLAADDLWTFIGVYASSFWLLGYAFANLKTRAPAPAELHAGYLRPFWGGYVAPIGKGVGFLRKFEAQNDTALAATRLKAVKLLVWAIVLQKTIVRLDAFATYRLGIPQLRDALVAQAHGHMVSPQMGWAILLAGLFIKVGYLAATGHVIVAIIRLAGFAIPRNTAKPFASRTVAEFWNRYYFYFKEILVDFFFFPAFTRFFKQSPKLRIGFATFCAAGVGNVLYHALFALGDIPQRGLADLFDGLRSFAIYAAALSAGIVASQLTRSRPKPEDGFFRYEVLPRLNVILFFCVLEVFDDLQSGVALSVRFAYCLNLVGIRV